MTTAFWLLRHAPVPGAAIGGDPMADTSDQARFAALARTLPADPVLVESGLARCRQTVAALRLELPVPIVEPALAEQDFGAWTGLRWDQIEAGAFWADPAGTAPPGGESFADVCRRVGPALRRLAASHQGRAVLAVIHAGSIRAALAEALDLAPAAALRFAVAPLSLTRLDRVGDGWRVGTVNWRGFSPCEN